MARLVKPKSWRALKRDIGFLEHSENVIRVSGKNFCVGEIQVGEMLQHRQRREFVPGGVIQLGGRKIESSDLSLSLAKDSSSFPRNPLRTLPVLLEPASPQSITRKDFQHSKDCEIGISEKN